MAKHILLWITNTWTSEREVGISVLLRCYSIISVKTRWCVLLAFLPYKSRCYLINIESNVSDKKTWRGAVFSIPLPWKGHQNFLRRKDGRCKSVWQLKGRNWIPLSRSVHSTEITPTPHPPSKKVWNDGMVCHWAASMNHAFCELCGPDTVIVPCCILGSGKFSVCVWFTSQCAHLDALDRL